MSERWQPIPGYEGLYEISDAGRIRSARRQGTRGDLLRQTLDRGGYYRITLSRDSSQRVCKVHQLVARAFLGEPAEGQVIRHLDGDSRNNNRSNLTYGTNSENMLDRVRHGRHHHALKTRCVNGHELTEENIRRVGNQRHCKPCRRQRNADYRRRQRLYFEAERQAEAWATEHGEAS